ncbi:DUF3000 domain-containing protein [Catenulispora sp. NF23]|uniref:DUF3000 domain-containing protein n=1 Tax=Catenulispora pinistramenti TaxID=2705254 RepID=UPI001BAB3CA4|nr:DUF3000 domain-containing protein [Catenulispora pinistramenti]MBS2538098.1 DUF3000 domain-containing protein [Catenulispora pinistramenti]
MAPSRAGDPREFAEAVAALSAASLPTAIELDALPSPVNLAPFAHAVGGAVVSADSEGGEEDLATGRLVLLHRPGGHEEWRGAWRFVVLVEADLEAEIAEDPLLAEVAWSWLMDALTEHGAPFTAEGGTVSRSSSRGFGGLAGRPATTAVEVRASWTPAGDDIDFAAHLNAWCALMMMCAGLPPEYEGVANLPPAGSRR